MSEKIEYLKKNFGDTAIAVMVAFALSGGFVLALNYIVKGAF